MKQNRKLNVHEQAEIIKKWNTVSTVILIVIILPVVVWLWKRFVSPEFGMNLEDSLFWMYMLCMVVVLVIRRLNNRHFANELSKLFEQEISTRKTVNAHSQSILNINHSIDSINESVKDIQSTVESLQNRVDNLSGKVGL